MDMTEHKAALRKAAFAARKLAHGAGLDGAAQARLIQWIGPVRGQVIAGYMPIRTEVSPLPVMEALAQDNRICVPVIDGAGQPLRFAAWSPGCTMVEGMFGAAIPADPVFLTPDVVIAPLVAFDGARARLGYGGGFYDRTLEGLRARGTLRAVGFAYAAQRMEAVPQELTDQPLDAIVTEAGVI